MANIFESICEIMKDVDAIGKDQVNQTQRFNFRGIDDVYNAVHPLLAKHGVFTIPTVLEDRTEERKTSKGGNLIYRILKIKYTFYASDGTSVDAVVIGEGMDSGDKAANKAMAVGHKYALLQTLSIPTKDMIDPDSESQDPSYKVDNYISKEQFDLLLKNNNHDCLKQAMVEWGLSKLGELKESQVKAFELKIKDIQKMREVK